MKWFEKLKGNKFKYWDSLIINAKLQGQTIVAVKCQTGHQYCIDKTQ